MGSIKIIFGEILCCMKPRLLILLSILLDCTVTLKNEQLSLLQFEGQ